MMVKDNFSIDADAEYFPVFQQNNVPLFQNKVYPSREEALDAATGKVELVQSSLSGFIFNKTFDPQLMNYDQHYQNEQSNSVVFQEHLQSVLNLLKSFGIEGKKVVEVGCGKGVFFEMMLNAGIDCWGFDPTYEGKNQRIKKEYFDEKQNDINADVIIMRHTLEHIPQPFSFLHTIARANHYTGFLFVEVPTFDWIVKKNAFWDIFYEHCNYFTETSLGSIFDYAKTGSFFGGQYIYLWADLSRLKMTITPGANFSRMQFLSFNKKLDEYKSKLNENTSIAIWGAGAKGSTFLNLLDKGRKFIQYVIDINPAKQNRFVAGTGHAILAPSCLQERPVDNILIMNENYIEEIKKQLAELKITINLLSL